MFAPRCLLARGAFFCVNGSQTKRGCLAKIGSIFAGSLTMNQHVHRLLRSGLCLALLTTSWLPAAARQSAQGTQPVPSRVTFVDAPSSEKPEARKKRLKKECQGRPNAGMCLGMTGRQ